MEIHPFSALFLLVQSRLTDAANAIFSDYCFTDTHLKPGRVLYPFFHSAESIKKQTPAARARRIIL